MKKKFSLFVVLLLSILYLELVFKIVIFKTLFNTGIIYTFVFSLIIALGIFLFIRLFKESINRKIFYISLGMITFIFMAQTVFFSLFDTLFSFYSLGLADQALDFASIAFNAILHNILPLVLLVLPFVISILMKKHIRFQKNSIKSSVLSLLIFVMAFVLGNACMIPFKSSIYSAYNLYHNVGSLDMTANKLGLMTAMRLDIQNKILNKSASFIADEETGFKEEKVKYNVSSIDFNELANNETDESITKIDKYINNQTPSKQNKYTGMYKGKNLIFLLAEGFNSIAVDEKITPTLYKLVNSSFVFSNYYSPVFLSTTGGEFQATTGLVPTQSILSNWKNNSPKISYALGNSFSKLGYSVQSFHDWTYTYYQRDKTMATIGFTNYMGCRNGLEKLMNCSTWPTSDVEMMNATMDKYLSLDHFVTYYVTVSGHAEYNFGGNYIAKKNQSLVSDLPYGSQIKAYLATQIELDKALELLLQKLEETGHIDDTVIALVGDHYPYTLSADIINEKSTYTRDSLFEVNHSNFILWSKDNEVTKIDKVGSQVDVLPTLLNLFGIEFDSRLIMGKDILSDTDGLAIFSNRSWITDYGRYNSSTKTFTLNEGKTVEDGYVDKINAIVSNKFTMSDLIIANDYYRKILGE